MSRALWLLVLAAGPAAFACGGDEPARDASDLTQFPAVSSMPSVQAVPISSKDEALWPDAGLNHK